MIILQRSAIEATLIVAKAPLTIIADDRGKFAGTANPELTITYDGFVNGEDESVLAIKPTISTQADINSPI